MRVAEPLRPSARHHDRRPLALLQRARPAEVPEGPADRAAPLPGGGAGVCPGPAGRPLPGLPRGARAAGRPARARDGAGSRERIGQIFGPELAARARRDPGGAGEGREAIRGFVGDPGDGARPAPVRLRQPPPDPRPRRARHLLPRGARRVEGRGLPGPLPLPRHAAGGGGRQRPSRRRRRSASAIPACSTGSTTPSAARLERARGEEAAPLRPPAAEPYVPFAWQGLGETARLRSPGIAPATGPAEVTGAPGPSGPWSSGLPHPAGDALLRSDRAADGAALGPAAGRPGRSGCWASTRGR